MPPTTGPYAHGGQPPELETRHYIAITPLGRVTLTYGPNDPAKFAGRPATEPVEIAGTLAYPVSAQIAQAWALDGCDPDTAEILAGECTCDGALVDDPACPLHGDD